MSGERSSIDTCLDFLGFNGNDLVRDARAELAALRRGLAFYKDREQHFAHALGVADGGQYRNDWDAALQRVVDERNALRRERDDLALIVRWLQGGARRTLKPYKGVAGSRFVAFDDLVRQELLIAEAGPDGLPVLTDEARAALKGAAK